MIRRGFRVFLPAIAAVALLAPCGANAAPPTGLAVTPSPYKLKADWELPPGMESALIEVSENQDMSVPFIEDPLDAALITYETTIEPGVHYVRVAAVAAGCQAACLLEYSGIVQVTIPPAPPAPVLTAVGHVGRHLTATWTLGAGTENSFIEAATSQATYPEGDFVDWVLFEPVLDPGQTTYTSPDPLDPGVYYVHVAAFDPLCPFELFCPDLFSDVVPVTIPPDPTPAPQPQPQTLPSPPPPTPPADKVTSFATLKCASTQKAGTLVVRAAMPENGTITVGGTVSVPNASKVFKLKRVTVKAIAGKTVKINVKLSAKALKAAKKALRRHRKVKASLTVTAKDGAGNSRSEKRSVKLKV